MAGEFVGGGARTREEEARSEAISNLRLLRAQRMAGAKSGRATAGQRGPGISGAASGRSVVEKGNQSAGETHPVKHGEGFCPLDVMPFLPPERAAATTRVASRWSLDRKSTRLNSSHRT